MPLRHNKSSAWSVLTDIEMPLHGKLQCDEPDGRAGVPVNLLR